jgi:prepilin-type processing-associated H-X9-DG protein
MTPASQECVCILLPECDYQTCPQTVEQQLVNVPADYHNGAGGTTFADGHAETHKWRNTRTLLPLELTFQKFVSAPNDQDLKWLQQPATSAD